MSKGPTKVYVKVESEAEQKQVLTKNRMTSKMLQKVDDKENVTRSPFYPLAKNMFTKSKSADIDNLSTETTLKRKKIQTRTTCTQTNAHNVHEKKQITAEDLTSSEPSEYYWKTLAEKRCEALQETLEENKNLYERIESLEQELSTSKIMLEEAKNLVEVLTEMLEENEGQTHNGIDDNKEHSNASSSNVNIGASTSGGDSCYFDTTNNTEEDSD